MNGSTIFTRLTGTKRNLLALLASSAMLTAGCANMATTAPVGGSPFATGAALSGKVHGGNQPVSNAVVNLYFAGESPKPAVLVATTTTSSKAADYGTFAFTQCVPGDTTTCSANTGTTSTFTCPTTSDDPLVYAIVTGGNTVNDGNSSTNNSAAAFIGIFGDCKELNNNFVDFTEVTTVATMAAIQQFFDPATGFISTDSTGNQKTIIDNTVNTINHMVNIATGTAVTSTTIAPANGNGVAGVTVTATPEYQKINSLANILASCVNNADATATPCATLFSSTTGAAGPNPATTSRPSGTIFNPPTTVLQAIYYILTNPTNNVSSLFQLIPSVGAPYSGLTSAPTDWTIAINYSSTSTCVDPLGNTIGTFISQPYDISVDRIGNVWFANSSANGNLSELGANGSATTCYFLSGGSHGGATIDPAGNIWLATTTSNHLYRYTPATNSYLTFSTAAAPLGVTADGLGAVYFTTAAGNLYQIPLASTTLAAVTPTQISSVVGPNPIRLMPDFQGTSSQSNIWVSSGSTYISRVTPGAPGDPHYLNNFSTTPFTTGLDSSYGIAVAYGNSVYVSSAGSDNYVTLLTGSGTNYSSAPGWPVKTGAGGINNPTAIAVDGADNIWVPNNTNDTTTLKDGTIVTTGGSVSEISAAANALSPATTGFEKDLTFLANGRASIVDQAGNVWIVGDGPAGTPSNYITEIVGAGVPIYQPYALGLSSGNGRFQQQP